ncbi:MAG: hypothetical protein AVDCRST_MAG49-2843, partial [uncultured Thermomicrobiales bacterium]
ARQFAHGRAGADAARRDAAAHRGAHRRPGAGTSARSPRRRRVVRQRGAGPSPRLRRRLGRLHRGDPRRGDADAAGRQSHHLDQGDGLSRPGVPPRAARLRRAARRAPGGPGSVAARRLVARGDGYRGGKATHADRADLRAVAGPARTAAHQAGCPHRRNHAHCDPPPPVHV